MPQVEMDQDMSASSDSEESLITDQELQEAFSKGSLKPGLNVVLEGRPKPFNNVNGLKQCLSEFQRHLAWVERLDVTSHLALNAISSQLPNNDTVNPEDDFKREMSFYHQAQTSVLEALPQLHQLKIPTRRPDDYFAEMAKSDQQMQKIRQKLKSKQEAMEKSERAKQLRAQRKYGKKVQTEVLQKRQKEKSTMLSAIKKYQKGLSDKLEFLEGEQQPASQGKKKDTTGNQLNKKGPNAKRRYKNQKFGFGGKKKGSKWNTRESHNDVSSFRASVAHNKGSGKAGKRGANKRPGKKMRQKMKNRSR
ncbi:probable rRNA-processing protein EBP2 [Hemicordylus capensis]|uniref:probable rRNA-processing protein EBP2 n=1 Tax=Hemicordylus capensis TaxID=884348 RepID=UPI002302E464|nr:probable rRNA-processing protein EBP2 [Hemicordylus capensis]XP_053099425.1 probable rRNA-processing protein EBP2 [Hemicordylus capensis]XP_053099426.1 probable rRNA-processing protein EBP2 [Hemicordylus capensis]XP_053099427.1 probable rRNA-processing protein EBP2 [Hemicordylus capensis]XP_053099428.1 probable rRNA-processing protein EBP2 [Hemicordylus capensis]